MRNIAVFDHTGSLHGQILIDPLTCPITRQGTRVEHDCDDWDLWRNPNLLLEHYIKNGGATAFARKREEFLSRTAALNEIEFSI